MKASAHRIALEGEYDLTRRDEVARLFDSLDGDGAVVIDLTDVTYLDSTVLKELARLRLRRAESAIVLQGANDNVRHIFKIVGFEELFDIV